MRVTATGAITLLSIALLTVGLAMAVATSAARAPAGILLSLGPAGADAPIATVAWTLAPAAFSLLFAADCPPRAECLLGALALLQVALRCRQPSSRLLSEPVVDRPGLLLDPLATALLLVSVVVGGLIVIYSLGYEPAHLHHTGQDPARMPQFMAWLFVFLFGMHLLVLADDLRLLAVGWEITTLCSYVLIGFDRTAEATTAARRALAYNLLGGAALAFGSVLAGPHGSMSGLLNDAPGAVLSVVVASLVIAAATKSALAPFHPWLLGAMVAAAPVSALLHASTMVKAGSYLLLRLSPAMDGNRPRQRGGPARRLQLCHGGAAGPARA